MKIAVLCLLLLCSFTLLAQKNNKDSIPIVYCYVEVFPTFPGSMQKYLENNLIYPKSAKDSGVEGRVFVKFIIDSVGFVDSVHVATSVHPDIDAEAVRVVKMMPRWTPAYQNGKSCKANLVLPIVFSLEGKLPLPRKELTPEEQLRRKFLEDSLANNYAAKPLFNWQKFLSKVPDPYRQYKAVNVTFLISAEGIVSDFSVEQTDDVLLNKYAMKVAKKMAKKQWSPGKRNGQFISYYCVLPIY